MRRLTLIIIGFLSFILTGCMTSSGSRVPSTPTTNTSITLTASKAGGVYSNCPSGNGICASAISVTATVKNKGDSAIYLTNSSFGLKMANGLVALVSDGDCSSAVTVPPGFSDYCSLTFDLSKATPQNEVFPAYLSFKGSKVVVVQQ